jgi:hypothetical protein
MRTAGTLVAQMAPTAKAKFSSEARWAAASGVTKETLSRLKRQPSCDFRTLASLAESAGFALGLVPKAAQGADHMPASLNREYEEELLDLAASGNVDPDAWRARGPAFFMGGLAAMLGSARGFSRERYLKLAEALHPGVSTPEVFGLWLGRTPVRASRFLPLARKRSAARASAQ